jgi:hypothetical protein
VAHRKALERGVSIAQTNFCGAASAHTGEWRRASADRMSWTRPVSIYEKDDVEHLGSGLLSTRHVLPLPRHAAWAFMSVGAGSNALPCFALWLVHVKEFNGQGSVRNVQSLLFSEKNIVGKGKLKI